MKIALVLHQFPPRHTTGTELYALRLAKAFERRGHSVVVFTGEDGGGAAVGSDSYAIDGIPVTRSWRKRAVEADPIRAGYDSPVAAAAFAAFLDREVPDVVHVFHLQGLGAAVLDVAAARGIPRFVHLMDYWLACPRTQMLDLDGALCEGPTDAARCASCAGEIDGDYAEVAGRSDPVARDAGLAAIRERWPAMRARLDATTAVFAPSSAIRDRFVANGLAADRIVLLPYGIDRASDTARGPREGGGPFRFGFLGNLASFKGAHVLLEAFAGWARDDVALRLHGDFFFREPAHESACRAWVEEDPRIELAGRFEASALPEVLADLDALVVPSMWYENTPFVVLEALCAGVPVIGSRVDGIAEAIEEGADGLLFDRGDVDGLRDAMATVADRPERLRPPTRTIPTTDDNAEALLERYAAAVAAPPAAVAGGERALREKLFDAFVALANLAGGHDGEGFARLREAAAATEELEGLRLTAAELRRERDALDAGVASLEAAMREAVDAAAADRETLLRDLAGHRASVDAITNERDALRTHASTLERENETLREHGATLSRDLDGHRVALRDGRAALADAERREAEARARADRIAADHEAALAVTKALENERDDLRARLERAEALYDDLQRIAEADRVGHAEVRARLNALQRALESTALGPNL